MLDDAGGIVKQISGMAAARVRGISLVDFQANTVDRAGTQLVAGPTQTVHSNMEHPAKHGLKEPSERSHG